MKRLIFIFCAISLFVISACETPESELILGKWKYSKLSKNGVLYLSSDRAEAQRIIDKHVSQNIEYMKDVAKFRDNAEEEMEMQLNVFIEIKEDSTFSITDSRVGAPATENWKYTIDEEKKQLAIKSGGRTITYVYKLKDDELSLSSEGMKIVLSRMKK